MRNILIITIGIILTLISNYLGHIYPPFSIDWTPILIGLFTGLVLYFTNFRLIIKFSLIIGLIIFNDILIKFYAGGTHDWEGVGWITVYLLLGLIISLVIIIIYGFTNQKENKKEYFLLIFAFSVLLFLYLSYFDSIGMTWVKYPTNDIKISKEKELFISNVELSDNKIIVEQDTFLITKGWFEKQIRINHKRLFKKNETTDKIYCTLILEGEFEKYKTREHIYYKLDDGKSRGYTSLNSTITLTLDQKKDKYSLGFYRTGWTKFKEIIIKNSH